MNLYLIRHGESEGNTGDDWGVDPVLTPHGRRQAECAGEALRDAGITHLYCSALRRALESAHIIGQALGLKPEAWPELVEVADWRMGNQPYTGLPRAEIAAAFPGMTFREGFPERDWWQIPVEDEVHAYQRALVVEAELRRRHQDTGDTVAAVSHGTFGSVLMASLMGLPPRGYTRFSQRNCAISLLELLPGTAKLRFQNRVEHLPEDGGPYAKRILRP